MTLEAAQRASNDYISEQVGIGPGRRVLDWGCGWGPMLDVVRRRGGQGVGGHALVRTAGGLFAVTASTSISPMPAS